MKFPQLFTKIPKHKRFEYIPRHYDPQEEERKDRELRIRAELEREGAIQKNGSNQDDIGNYRERMTGSFRQARKTASRKQSDPSASMIRLAITLILTLGLIAYLQFGKNALYGVAAIFIPFYLYLKFRNARR